MMEEIIKKARKWIEKEIGLNGSPLLSLVVFSYEEGVRLAKIFKADVDIVKIGMLLGDIKLGETKNQGRIGEHTKVGAKAVEKFLEDFDLEEVAKEKIINCVEMHHGGKYVCKEAEICANADCYRFIHPKGVFVYLEHLGREEENITKNLEQLEYKLDEKWKILSLDICKKELEPYYHEFKKLITVARIG